MFVLDKWYLDAVAADGAAFIGYAAALRWGGLAVRYDAFLLSPALDAPRERATVRGGRPPARRPDGVAWESPALGVRGTWQHGAPRVRRRLHRDARGSVLWSCEMPRAEARVTAGTDVIEGTGYVERLRMTVSPLDLPLQTLHWGRFHAPGETLIWIAWQHGAAGRWIFRNGALQKHAALFEKGIHGLDGGAELVFNGRRTIRDRPVLPVLGLLPGLRGRAARGLADMQEKKWVGRAALRADGRITDGWLIHEEVTWSARGD